MGCERTIRLLAAAFGCFSFVCAAGGQEPPGALRGWYAPVQGGGTAPKRICFEFDPLSKSLDEVTFAKAQAVGNGNPDCPGGVLVKREFRPRAISQFEFARPLDDPPPRVSTLGALPLLLFNVKLEKGTVRVILLRRKWSPATGEITHLYLEPIP